MVDFSGIKLEPHFKLNIGKASKKGSGGNGGSILIFTDRLKGEGIITANGGKGLQGGKGGCIHIIAKKNDFGGDVSAKGGESDK